MANNVATNQEEKTFRLNIHLFVSKTKTEKIEKRCGAAWGKWEVTECACALQESSG